MKIMGNKFLSNDLVTALKNSMPSVSMMIRKRRHIAVIVLFSFCSLTFAGCGKSNCSDNRCCCNARGYGIGGLEEYLAEMKNFVQDKETTSALMVGISDTTREYVAKYEIIYADSSKTIFSYRYDGHVYEGGAHGFHPVRVGTIEVASWRRLTLADVIPPDKRTEALARLKSAVIRKIGAENLADEVKLTDNFCVMEDGLHFVFVEYEIAAFSFGPIEVVIPAYGKYGSLDEKRKE